MLDKFVSLKPPQPSVAHDDVFETFKDNLAKCLSNHDTCTNPDENHLPTRLLVVDNDAPDRVFVHECAPDDRGSYVALSYCWGKKTTQTMLLMSNREEFKSKGVVVSTLPKTIQDSIVATRKLGIKYLWIDSLCIIQDSAADKDNEIAGMASIYRNATITISAAATTDCGDGFLEDRADVQLRIENSMRLPLMDTAETDTQVVIDYVYVCPEPQLGYKLKRFDEEPINNRAWTYQESTLAERLIIFGSGPPQWHCKEDWRIYGLDIHPDDLPHPMCVTTTMKIAMQNRSIVPEATMKYLERPDPPKDEIGLLPSWMPLLENYSKRDLSVRTDKLLAISALAAEKKSPGNGTYAAGLWEASLPRSLLWRRHSDIDRKETAQHANRLEWLRTRLFDSTVYIDVVKASSWSSRYIAPTWSPMSATEPIAFEAAATQTEDEYHTSLVTINNIHIDPTTPLNPFGRLDFAYLDVTAPMRQISWEELITDYVVVRSGQPFDYWDFIVPDDPTYFLYLGEKYGAPLTLQMLGDTNTQHPIDEGEAQIFIGDNGTMRIQAPVQREVASRQCKDADVPFKTTNDVRHQVLEEILGPIEEMVRLTPPTSPAPPQPSIKTSKSSRRCCWPSSNPVAPAPTLATQHESETVPEPSPPEFWLLEVERSMAPAGLVLQRIHNDIFARIGYFGMNRSLDPEIVYMPGLLQVRGPKAERGQPVGMGWWYDSLARKRIYLV